MTLPVVCELRLDGDVDSSDIEEAIQSSGFNLKFRRQTHDTIRDVEALEYYVDNGDNND